MSIFPPPSAPALGKLSCAIEIDSEPSPLSSAAAVAEVLAAKEVLDELERSLKKRESSLASSSEVWSTSFCRSWTVAVMVARSDAVPSSKGGRTSPPHRSTVPTKRSQMSNTDRTRLDATGDESKRPSCTKARKAYEMREERQSRAQRHGRLLLLQQDWLRCRQDAMCLRRR